jgi:hypothetical protein
MNFSSLFYREKEIVKINFWNLFLSYFGNFVFIFSLLIILNKENFFSSYIVIYFLSITQSQLFLYIFNKIDEREQIFDYLILTFSQQIKFIITRFISVFILNILFCICFSFGLKIFFSENSFEFNLFLILSNFIIILNTTIIHLIIFSNKGKFLTNFVLLFLIPCNLPAIIFFANNQLNYIYLSLLISLINFMILSFLNKIR